MFQMILGTILSSQIVFIFLYDGKYSFRNFLSLRNLFNIVLNVCLWYFLFLKKIENVFLTYVCMWILCSVYFYFLKGRRYIRVSIIAGFIVISAIHIRSYNNQSSSIVVHYITQ